MDILEPVVNQITVEANNAVADGTRKNKVKIYVTDSQGIQHGGSYPVTLSTTNSATLDKTTVTPNSIGLAYVELTSKTAGESVITATTGYGDEKSVAVFFRPGVTLSVTGVDFGGRLKMTISLKQGEEGISGEEFYIACSTNGDTLVSPCGTLKTNSDGVINYQIDSVDPMSFSDGVFISGILGAHNHYKKFIEFSYRTAYGELLKSAYELTGLWHDGVGR